MSTILAQLHEHDLADDPFARIAALESRNAELAGANAQLRIDIETLRRLVYLDALTGLGNRRHFDVVLEAELRRAARAVAPVTLLLCDIDCFKSCNDLYGHEAGDAVLIGVAEMLKGFQRRGGDTAVRYGGDEFALVLPDVGGNAAEQLAEELRRAAGTVVPAGSRTPPGYRITLSIGAATFESARGCAPEELLAAADAALYRAKRKGRNRIELAVWQRQAVSDDADRSRPSEPQPSLT